MSVGNHLQIVSVEPAPVSRPVPKPRPDFPCSHEVQFYPLDHIGLGAALKEYAEQFAVWRRVKVNLEIAENLGRLGRKVEMAVFRIVEEALANVRQHRE